MTVTCGNCGTDFGAKRKTALYCSGKCRVAQTRLRQRLGVSVPERAPVVVQRPAPTVKPAVVAEELEPKVVPPRRDGAQIYALPAVSDSSGASGFYRKTLRQLQDAGQEDSYPGMAALFAAQMLDSGVQDTMSSMASMLKEYKASMRDALASVRDAKSPLDEIREALKLA